MSILAGCQQLVNAEGASKVMPVSLPRHHTRAILSLHQELAFCSTSNGRPRWARAGLGSMAISCAVCSVQRAVCRRARARPSPLPSRIRTDELRQNGADQPPATPQAPPHLQTLNAGDRQQADDHLRQFLFLSMCCMLRCGSSCSGPRFPLALVPRNGGIRRQNVVA